MSRSSAWDRPLRRCQALVGRRMEAGSPVPRSRRSRLRRVQTEVCPVCADAGYRGPAGSGAQSADFAHLMVLLEGIELSTSPLPRVGFSVKGAENRHFSCGYCQRVAVPFEGFLVQWHRKLSSLQRSGNAPLPAVTGTIADSISQASRNGRVAALPLVTRPSRHRASRLSCHQR